MLISSPAHFPSLLQYLYVDALEDKYKSVCKKALAGCNLGCPDPLPLAEQGLLVGPEAAL